MSIAFLALVVGAIFTGAYFLYGKRVARRLVLKDDVPTPAVALNDGIDFVPTKKPILLAQHFASIAAAGPVVGPIAAGLAFGWGPTLIWIVVGCVLIGAAHDLSTLAASVKHGAKSLPEIAKANLGPSAYRLSLAFVWICLIYVLIAFTDVTAQQFVAKETWGGQVHDIGGGVATSSFLYLGLSILMGFSLYKWKVPLWLCTAVFLPLLVAVIFLGQKMPITFAAENPTQVWGVLILAYCFVASLLPLWTLLQPRGYLGGFFLYAILAIGILGLLFGGFQVQYPMMKGFFSGLGEPLYPFLFITVACGACSGFHGLVCCGTTSKQLAKETEAPLIGYGGMLLEGLVAVMALTTVMIWPQDSQLLTRSPAEIYATGIAHFAHSLFGLGIEWGLAFGMLAFATFVYDTLDVSTRLGRYLMEELFGLKGLRGMVIATLVTLAVPLLYVVTSPTVMRAGKQIPLWLGIWHLFGSSNQLLAALTLFLLSVWQVRRSAKWVWLLVPALFMFVTTTLALAMQLKSALAQLFTAPAFLPALNVLLTGLLIAVSLSFSARCLKLLRSRADLAPLAPAA